MQRNQHRFLFGFLAAVVLVGGCQGPTSVDSSASRASTDVPAEDDLSNLDLGGDWSDFEQQLAIHYLWPNLHTNKSVLIEFRER